MSHCTHSIAFPISQISRIFAPMQPPIDDFPYTNDHHPAHSDFVRMDIGEMTEDEQVELMRHLNECQACKTAYDAWVQNGRPTDLNNDT